MLEHISVFVDWITKYSGESLFLLVVLAAAVYIWIFMREARVKLIIPVVVCTVVVANPLSFEFIFRHVVYWRLFWMIPDAILVAVAGAHIVQRWRNDLVRILLAVALCVVVVLTGTNVYTKAAFGINMNPEKLPQGIIDVAETILALDKEPRCIVRDRYLTEIRQYSGDIRLYYGRNVFGYIIPAGPRKRRFRQILESDEPKPEEYEEILRVANKYGYDFVVTHISKPIPSEIAGKYGFRVVAGMDGSTIYYCPEICHEPATEEAAKEKETAVKEAKVRKRNLRQAYREAKAQAAREAELARLGLSEDDGTAQLWGEAQEAS